MGLEHRITIDLPDEEKNALHIMLTMHYAFVSYENIDEGQMYKFKTDKSDNGMPDFWVIIEDGSIYICDNQNFKNPPGKICLENYLQGQQLFFHTEEL